MKVFWALEFALNRPQGADDSYEGFGPTGSYSLQVFLPASLTLKREFRIQVREPCARDPWESDEFGRIKAA